MDSTRQLKISRLLLKELGYLFQINSRKYTNKGLITITKVNVTKDMGLARVNLSLFGVGDKQETLKTIKHHTSEIRRDLGLRIRNQVRIIPELEFFEDDALDYIENIENLLKK